MTYIIVVNYNKYEDTFACAESLLRTNATEAYHIVIVDNASTNDSWERLQELKDNRKITLLLAEENKGYCAGNNIGIRYAMSDSSADYVWILNPDTLVAPDALQRLHDFAQAKPDLGILGCKLVYYPDTQYLQALGGGNFGIQKHRMLCPGRHLYHLQSTDIELPEVVELDLIIGASMYIPVKIFQACGLMDERFHLYQDETEFCLRAAKFGFAHYAISSATVYHKEGWRQSEQKLEAVYYGTRNLLILTKMHFPRYLARNVFFTFASRRFLSYIIRGKRRERRMLCRAVRDFFAGVEGKADLSKEKR